MQRLISRCYSTSTRQSYYDILGLQKIATADEIKKAFYILSKKYHPDLTGGNEAATKKFVNVKEAYDTLKNEYKRKAYDYQMARNQGYQTSNSYQKSSSSENSFEEEDPFLNNSVFEVKCKNGIWEVFYQKNNTFIYGQNLTEDEFEKIWLEYQRKAQDLRNAYYENMSREHERQKEWYDSSDSQTKESYNKNVDEDAPKTYPSESSKQLNWGEKWLISIVIYFIIAALIFSVIKFYIPKRMTSKPANT